MAAFAQLSFDQLPDVMNKLKQYIPHTLPIFHTADNVIRGRVSLEDVQFFVNTWPHPTCVVLFSPANAGQLHNYRSTVDVWSETSEAVISFLQNKAVLDWSQPMFFRVQDMNERELKELQTTLTERGGTWSCVERHIYVQDPPSDQSTQQLPEGYSLLGSLSPRDAETVGHQYSAWGVQPSQAVLYFQYCCARLPGSGVQTQDRELVAYAALHHTSALGSVVTAPQHQRKGLGRAVVSDVCARIRLGGQIPYVYVNPENTASAALYSRCGFVCKAKAFRVRFLPEKSK